MINETKFKFVNYVHFVGISRTYFYTLFLYYNFYKQAHSFTSKIFNFVEFLSD